MQRHKGYPIPCILPQIVSATLPPVTPLAFWGGARIHIPAHLLPVSKLVHAQLEEEEPGLTQAKDCVQDMPHPSCWKQVAMQNPCKA